MKSVTDNSKPNTRDVILRTIKEQRHSTVDDLARAADVSPVTVRHHLNMLQADGLLTTEAVRRKVGRPYFIYSLSEKAQELFPQKYARLSSRLLDELKANFPAGTISTLCHGVVQQIVAKHRREFEHRNLEDRLDYLVELLSEEGFLARWEKTEAGYQITEYSCPYLSVGQKHHEVCVFDKTLITTILQTDVQQHSCMLEGDNCCHFTVPLQSVAV